MFRHFFLNEDTRCVAWSGIAFIVLGLLSGQLISLQITLWNGQFF